MQNSKIEWTDHTFNPWWGCLKVSPGCEHCYADTLARRYGFDVWGPAKTTSRRMMSENYWKQPHKWNRDAEADGVRRRVFCASMADVFEAHPDVEAARKRLFNLILETPNLDWLLLTKRPENIVPMLRAMPVLKRDNVFDNLWPHHFPNVWLGTSVENQAQADKRIPYLLRTPAHVRFLSCEPLLGAVNLDHYLIDDWTRIGDDVHWHEHPALHWVIAGGESGPHARPMHPEWARSLRDQCQAAGVPFFFKQHGEWLSFERTRNAQGNGCYMGLHGQRVDTATLMQHSHEIRDDLGIVRLGKARAGRLLDGREWNEVPA